MTLAARPAHVPDELVRSFSIDFHGPLDELFPRMDALRDEGRVVWVPVGGGLGGITGAWLLTHAEDIRHALQHPELFSSALGEAAGIPAMIPLRLDPPDHTAYRRLLNPLFSPGVVAAMEAWAGRRASRRSGPLTRRCKYERSLVFSLIHERSLVFRRA